MHITPAHLHIVYTTSSLTTHLHVHDAHTHTNTAASGNFVIMDLGTLISIECTAPSNIAQVQWFSSQNQMLSTGQIPNVEVHGDTLSIINATASLNGAQFHCRGEDLNGNVQLWQHYSIIVSGMLLNYASVRMRKRGIR